jgi:hypothetical protein
MYSQGNIKILRGWDLSPVRHLTVPAFEPDLAVFALASPNSDMAAVFKPTTNMQNCIFFRNN